METEDIYKERYNYIIRNSKCPECGSIDVKVEFRLGFSYTNESKDFIRLERDYDQIELKCNECKEIIMGGNYSIDRRLDKLLIGLIQAIKPPRFLKKFIDGDRNIYYSRFRKNQVTKINHEKILNSR